MHEHDLDLVAALADGSLDGDTGAIEALVAGCRVCGEEYRAQVAVRSLLADLPALRMTDAERTSVRAAVDAALPSPEPDLSPVPAPRSSPWWWRLVPAAGAAVLVLAVAGVFVGGSGEDTRVFENVGADLGANLSAGGDARSSATTAAAEQTTTTLEAGGGESIAPLAEPEEGDIEEGGPDATVPPTTIPEDAADETPNEADVTSRYRAGALGSLEELVALFTDPDRGDVDFAPEVEFLCIEAASQPPVDGIIGEVDGITIELFRLAPGGGEPLLEAFSSAECAPVDLPG